MIDHHLNQRFGFLANLFSSPKIVKLWLKEIWPPENGQIRRIHVRRCRMLSNTKNGNFGLEKRNEKFIKEETTYK